MSTANPSANAGRPRFGGARATLLLASILAAFMAASSTPTPLYRLYQEAWGFSPVILTAIFSAYAISLLLALLILGRSPIMLAAAR